MSCPCGRGCPTYVNGNQRNAARRPACQPAINDVRWVVDRRTNSRAAGGA